MVANLKGWKIGPLGAAWLSALLLGTARGDEVALPDGKVVHGKLQRKGGRLVFLPARRDSPLPLDPGQLVRLPSTPIPPLRAATVHQVILTGDGRLTGELLELGERELHFRPAWSAPLTIPRHAVAALVQPAGFLTFFDEDFEKDLQAWTVTGKPGLGDRQSTSGKRSLLLDAPGQAVEFRLSAPLTAGRVGVNCRAGREAVGRRWLLEADFQGPKGPWTVRVVIAAGTNGYTAVVPDAEQKPFAVSAGAGWRRLGLEFSPTTLLVTVDNELLWVSRERGPAGPLSRVRLRCEAVGRGRQRGAASFDDFALARAVPPLHHHQADRNQDELWLLSGDQVLGTIPRADRRTIAFRSRFAARAWTWGEVRGIALRQGMAPPRTTTGEHVTVWLRTGAGPHPDRVAGVVRALDERRLTLNEPVLGEMEIDRGRVRRLRWDFSGQRIELDRGPHHLGPKGKLLSGLQPARAEGERLRWTFRLDAVPASARLQLQVVHLKGKEDDVAAALERGELRTEVVVNGAVVDYLNRHVLRSSGQPRRLTVALPRRVLQRGSNVLLLRQTPEQKTGHYENCGVSDLVVEVPR
jgi:hypothetical protein